MLIDAFQTLARRQNKAATLECDVPYRRLPRFSIVNRNGAIQLDTFRVHCRSQKRHVVFPTNHGADTAKHGRDDGQGRAIAAPPNHSLHGRRHYLAVLAEKLAIRPKKYGGAIERATVALNHTGDKMNLIVSRHSFQHICRRSRDLNRIFPIVPEAISSFLGPNSDSYSKVVSLWITTHERFWENHQLGALFCGVCGKRTKPVKAAPTVERYRTSLNDGRTKPRFAIKRRSLSRHVAPLYVPQKVPRFNWTPNSITARPGRVDRR